MSSFNTQKFERQIYNDNQITGNKNFSMVEAEKYLNDERVKGIKNQEILAKQVDDMMIKDLKGASLVRDLESKYERC